MTNVGRQKNSKPTKTKTERSYNQVIPVFDTGRINGVIRVSNHDTDCVSSTSYLHKLQLIYNYMFQSIQVLPCPLTVVGLLPHPLRLEIEGCF